MSTFFCPGCAAVHIGETETRHVYFCPVCCHRFQVIDVFLESMLETPAALLVDTTEAEIKSALDFGRTIDQHIGRKS
jgi:hypothetical protein